MSAETHKNRANAFRLAPSSNPCWSQTFLPLSGLWSEGASLPKRSEASRGPISAKPVLQRWSHSVNRTTPCPLIHHITLLRALLRAEGKEARGEGWEGGGESPADLVTHAPKKTCSGSQEISSGSYGENGGLFYSY